MQGSQCTLILPRTARLCKSRSHCLLKTSMWTCQGLLGTSRPTHFRPATGRIPTGIRIPVADLVGSRWVRVSSYLKITLNGAVVSWM
jgi:hypothetical protein